VAYLVSDYESTDITNIAQLYVFICSVTEDFEIIRELHYLAPVKKGGDTILSWIDNFFYKHELPWRKRCLVCSDGTFTMCGKKDDDAAELKKKKG